MTKYFWRQTLAAMAVLMCHGAMPMAQVPGAPVNLRIATGGAVVTPAYRQSGYFECQPASTCSGTFNVPGNSADPVQPGNLMVVTSRTDNNSAIAMTSVVTDRKDTCSSARNVLSKTSFRLDVWACPNAVGGQTRFTVTHSGGVSDHQMRITVTEYSGVATGPLSSILESSVAAQGAGTCNAGTITTTGPRRLIHVSVASDGDDDADAWDAGSGYTLHNLGGDPNGSDKTMTEHRIAASAGSYATNMTGIQDGTSACVALAFRPQ